MPASDAVRRKILERRARFVGAALAGLTGCGNSSPTAAPDASADVAGDVFDGGTPFDAPQPEACLAPPPPPPVGAPCKVDGDCAATSFGDNQCSLGAFGDPILPTPVCIDTVSCGLDTATLERCGSGTGVCAGSVCWPKCEFSADGAPPKGCLGKNACTAAANGVGFCFAGCADDADCPAGSQCQPESGWCVRTVVAFAKALGEPCAAADEGVACHCVLQGEDEGGYCTRICRAGDATCPTGFLCDVRLGAGDYPLVPAGLLGHCAKECAVDADCPAGTCVVRAGTAGKKVCAVGEALRK